MSDKYFTRAEYDALDGSYEELRDNLGLVLYSAKNANNVEDSA